MAVANGTAKLDYHLTSTSGSALDKIGTNSVDSNIISGRHILNAPTRTDISDDKDLASEHVACRFFFSGGAETLR